MRTISGDGGESRLQSWAWMAGGALLLALFGFGIVQLVKDSGSAPRKTVPEVVQLRLLPPPPPPPPPPAKPKIEEAPKLKQPEFKAVVPENRPPSAAPKAEAPPGPPALDAVGNGPGDAFGLEGRPGGGEWFGGEGGGGGGSAIGWYATLIQQRAQEAVQKQRRLIGARYRVGVRLWLDADGRPSRVELAESTGDAELDRLLRETLGAMDRPDEAPPQGLPQPVVLRVTSS